ncbi:MAG: DUF402 domain-containing protein [Bacilli bacterium]|nr:DUF402 domain-containing protein [Bacilli bacterium]
MQKVKVGDELQIQCYKHNGKINCNWHEAVIIDVFDDYIVCANSKSLVTEADGSVWKTKEPAIMYFFKNHWFNVIAQLKKTGISYYCNIATPYIIEDNTIKYIDYDLDLRIFSNGSYKILDRNEYKYHKKLMGYSDILDKSIKHGLDDLINFYKNGNIIFDEKLNLDYRKKYLEIKNKQNV